MHPVKHILRNKMIGDGGIDDKYRCFFCGKHNLFMAEIRGIRMIVCDDCALKISEFVGKAIKKDNKKEIQPNPGHICNCGCLSQEMF